MEKFLFTLSLMMFGLTLFAQTEQVDRQNEAKYLDSLFLAEMMFRREVDDFTNEIKIDCPVLGTPARTVHLIKTINRGKVQYFMRLMTQGSSVVVDGKGVYILFTNGTKLMKEGAKVTVDTDHNGYSYSAFLLLTSSDLKILASKNIKKFRLYIFDGELNERESEQFRIYAKNIVLTK